MIVYKSRFLTRGEVWFDDEPGSDNIDFIVYHQRSKPVPNARVKEFYSRVVDLRSSPEVLLSQMDRTTIYKIKKARDKEKIVCDCPDPSDPAVLKDFTEFYDRFAQQRGWDPMDRHWLIRTAQSGSLDLARACSPEGELLVYHSLVRTKNRVRGIHSVSFFRDFADSAARSYVGRANRFLHWNSMLRYKEQGVTIYDFGGWYTGTADPERLRINDFKKGFGGEVVCDYDCEQIVSMKGRLLLSLARALRRGRALPSNLSETLRKTFENHRTNEVPAPLR